MVHRPGGVIHSLVYHILFAWRGLATFTRKSIPSNVLATVRSWIRGFSGSHLFSSLFIRASVSNSFVYDFLLAISHLFVHAHVVSTFSWSLPALSDVAGHNGSCRWSVHSERVRDHKIIFLLVLKSPHDSLCVRVVFGFFVAFCLRSENLYKANEGDEVGVQLKITTCISIIKKHWIVCTSALMIVLFILMPSRNAIELQTVG